MGCNSETNADRCVVLSQMPINALDNEGCFSLLRSFLEVHLEQKEQSEGCSLRWAL